MFDPLTLIVKARVTRRIFSSVCLFLRFLFVFVSVCLFCLLLFLSVSLCLFIPF